MMALIEEMRQAVFQIWQSLGFERSAAAAAAVIPALVLGVALNAVALDAVNDWCADCHAKVEKAAMAGIAPVGVKVVKVVVVSTLRKIDDGQRRLNSARQWVLDRRTKAVRRYSKMRCVLTAEVSSKVEELCMKTELLKGFIHCQGSALSVA